MKRSSRASAAWDPCWSVPCCPSSARACNSRCAAAAEHSSPTRWASAKPCRPSRSRPAIGYLSKKSLPLFLPLLTAILGSPGYCCRIPRFLNSLCNGRRCRRSGRCLWWRPRACVWCGRRSWRAGCRTCAHVPSTSSRAAPTACTGVPPLRCPVYPWFPLSCSVSLFLFKVMAECVMKWTHRQGCGYRAFYGSRSLGACVCFVL